MSSFLAFRYIERNGMEFYPGMHHKNITPVLDSKKTPVGTAEEIGIEIGRQLDQFNDRKIGVMLSGGMDSGIVASFVPGAEAYTFRFLGGEFQKEELARAEYYAKCSGLHLHYVDISWDTVERHVDAAIPQDALDKFKAWEKLRFDILFVGDDWYGDPRWKELEEKFKDVGVRVVYFPYTKGTSSTILNETLKIIRG